VNVLFVGNSHTFRHDMAFLFKRFCDFAGIDTYVVQLGDGGQNLETHSRSPQLRFNLHYGKYAYVVLQEKTHPMPEPEKYLADIDAIASMAKSNGAKPVVYMTWAEKAFPEHLEQIKSAHIEAAKRTGGILCPVGMAFEHVNKYSAEIELYDDDGRHMSICGAYLAALMLFDAVTGKSAAGLPAALENYQGEKLCDLDAGIADILQKTADIYRVTDIHTIR
jgi:hypothetical protein